MTWHTQLTAALVSIVALAKPALADTCSYSASWTAMRPQTHQLANLVDIGIRQSPTLRQLVLDVERRCGVVFISEMNPVLERRKALGLTAHRVAVVATFRYLQVVVDTRPGAPEVISTIGHELQHVIEVLDSRATTPAEIGALFNRIGIRVGPGVFETSTAAQLGAKIRREVLD